VVDERGCDKECSVTRFSRCCVRTISVAAPRFVKPGSQQARPFADLARGAALAEARRMRFVALVALCLVAGCSLFMRSIEKPKADVRAVSVSSAGFTGLTGELALDVTNPNGFGVPLSGID